MKISVVTASLNAAATIHYTLDSFLSQNHKPKELVLIDGGSTDETVAIARSYDSAEIVIVCERDRGIYEAMNKGLDRFTGDAVGFLNADDRFADPDCLTAISEALHEADIIHGNLDIVADHVTRRLVRRWRSSDYRLGAFRSGWMPPHPTFYVRRDVVEKVGKFNVKFRISADYDYMLRALELHGLRSAFVHRVLVEMQHGGRSTRNLGAYWKSNWESHQSRRTHLGVGLLSMSLLAKPIRKLPQLLAMLRLQATE